jgi:hypothetical protein
VFASGSTWNINNSAYVTLKGLSFPYDLASGNLVQFRGTSNRCRVTRCLFGPTSIGTPGANKSPFVYMGDNVDFIRVDHNEMRNKSNPGNSILGDGNFTTFQAVRHIRIDHNYIHDIRPEVDNEKEPIRLGVSTMSKTFSNSVIERNVFANCIAEPEIVSAKACGIRITGNVFSKSIGGPVYRHGTNGIMNDNYVVDDAVDGGGTTPPPDPDPDPNPGTRTVGPGGVPRPAPGPNVVLATGNTTSGLSISQSGTPGNPRIWDGGGFRVGKITISAGVKDVIVQNYVCNPDGVYGVEIKPNGCQRITVQHLKFENIHGPGDLNGITFHGCQDLNILYNDFTDFVTGDPGGSHTDCIQTWNNDPNEASQRVIIQGNKFWGPLASENRNFTIHQCIMAQGKAATDGGGGGSGEQLDWYVADNTMRGDWNQDCKFEDIDNCTVTRNKFVGASSRAVEARSTSSNFKFYSDNEVGSGYGSVGVTITPGNGPTRAPWLTA